MALSYLPAQGHETRWPINYNIREELTMRALITGATGFIGRRLLRGLERAVVLTRNAQRAEGELAEFDVTVFGWNPLREEVPPEALEGVDAVFHLAGEPVAEGRWTRAKKQRIRESRVLGTRNLVATLCRLEHPPRVLISASAVGYYGDRGDEVLDETAEASSDFLGEVCVAWERESQQAAAVGVRVLQPRFGIVLGADGGALPRMISLFRKGLGSPLGSGRQWMPWIHVDDLVRLLMFLAEHEEVTGPVNGTAPQPVTNREFTRALSRSLGRPAFLPAVPPAVLRLALGEFAGILLASQQVVPRVAEAAGFDFQYPRLEEALADLVR
jgi:uncharacterized protein (TIGR01777 family)